MADSLLDEFDDTRKPRATNTREFTERPKQWRPPSVLPEPENKRDGYSYRWVRVQSNGKDDPANFSARVREGFEPVLLEEHPEFAAWLDHSGKSDTSSRVQVGGLVLCKIPNSFVEEREKYYARTTKAQLEAVENDLLRENLPRLSIERKSKFGSGA